MRGGSGRIQTQATDDAIYRFRAGFCQFGRATRRAPPDLAGTFELHRTCMGSSLQGGAFCVSNSHVQMLYSSHVYIVNEVFQTSAWFFGHDCQEVVGSSREGQHALDGWFGKLGRGRRSFIFLISGVEDGGAVHEFGAWVTLWCRIAWAYWLRLRG